MQFILDSHLSFEWKSRCKLKLFIIADLFTQKGNTFSVDWTFNMCINHLYHYVFLEQSIPTRIE